MQKKQVAAQKGRSIEAVQLPAVKEKGPKPDHKQRDDHT